MFAVTLFIAALLGIVPIVATPPNLVFVKSHLLPKQPGKEAFDKLYMGIAQITEDPIVLIPTFFELNSNAAAFILEETQGPVGAFPSLYELYLNGSTNGDHFAATMFFTGDLPYAGWQPVEFLFNETELNVGQSQGRFTLNGTGPGGKRLSWNNFPARRFPFFSAWLICDWAYGISQLFFATGPSPGYVPPLPANCAAVELQAIPVPNAH